MKKFFLSSFVIFSFALYATSLQTKGTDATFFVTPINLPAVTPTLPIGNMPMMNYVYKNGTYIGSVADAYYGNVQVRAIIAGGKITDVQFLAYPNDRQTSLSINTQAIPDLKNEAIVAQSANVDIVSGATATSQAFVQSLQSALSQAKN